MFDVLALLFGAVIAAASHYGIRSFVRASIVAALVFAGAVVICGSIVRGSVSNIWPIVGAIWFVIGLVEAVLVGIPFALLRPRPIPPGHCKRCGYNLTGLPEPRCPECGQRFEPKGDAS